MYHSPITLEALIVLDAIDSRGSFAAAAEQLNKVPSALSYIVQKLEEQLSVTLFIRQGRRSVLTPAGRHLLEEGRRLLGAVSKVTEQTQTIAHGWEPRIRVAIDSIFDVQLLLAPLQQFLHEHPNIEVDLSEEVMSGTWETLTEDRVELLVGAPGSGQSVQGIRTQFMGQVEQAFVVSNNHPLAARQCVIDLVELSAFRTVVVHDSARNAVPWSSNVIEQSQRFYVRSVAHKIDAIQAGVGCGYLPVSRIQGLLDSGSLVKLDLQHQVATTELYMAWKTINKGKGLMRLRQIISEAFQL